MPHSRTLPATFFASGQSRGVPRALAACGSVWLADGKAEWAAGLTKDPFRKTPRSRRQRSVSGNWSLWSAQSTRRGSQCGAITRPLLSRGRETVAGFTLMTWDVVEISKNCVRAGSARRTASLRLRADGIAGHHHDAAPLLINQRRHDAHAATLSSRPHVRVPSGGALDGMEIAAEIFITTARHTRRNYHNARQIMTHARATRAAGVLQMAPGHAALVARSCGLMSRARSQSARVLLARRRAILPGLTQIRRFSSGKRAVKA